MYIQNFISNFKATTKEFILDDFYKMTASLETLESL